MYVTASQIQDSPWFNERWTRKGTELFKFGPTGAAAGESGTTTGRER
jgi:hypothetical protein